MLPEPESTSHKSYGINDNFIMAANVLSKRGDVNKKRIYFDKATIYERHVYIKSLKLLKLHKKSGHSTNHQQI